MENFLVETNNHLAHTIEHLKQELSGIRAGRANPAMLENIPVEAYGGKMKMIELGTISAPQNNLLVIQAWDQTVIHAIQKAISESNLGLNPAVDGTTVRVPIPPLSEERRDEYIKVSHQKGEEAKISVRQIRSDARTGYDAEKTAGTISEDELFRREKLLQNLVDKVTAEIDELVKTKSEELKQI